MLMSLGEHEPKIHQTHCSPFLLPSPLSLLNSHHHLVSSLFSLQPIFWHLRIRRMHQICIYLMLDSRFILSLSLGLQIQCDVSHAQPELLGRAQCDTFGEFTVLGFRKCNLRFSSTICV